MRKLVLLSSSKLLKKALETLVSPFPSIKLAHITTAGKAVDDLDYIDRTKAILNELGVQFEDYDLDGKNPDQLRADLGKFDAIFLNGGNTFYLLKSIRESGFTEVIKELLDDDKLYIGASAGSYVACKSIIPSTWTNSHGDMCGLTDFTAMGLVPFSLKAHHTPDKDNWLAEKKKELPANLELKTLTDNQALVITGDQIELIKNS